mmetsp:Transcript_2220/g.3339  ORF Transcript_2220/g.3339 Transcript_2220/m.3339 type:complete len:344 (+) Transcript_2220:2255-3286(+)
MLENSAKDEEAKKIHQEYERQRIEMELLQKKMREEEERFKKQMQEQKKEYDRKLKNDMHVEQTRRKMKDLKKNVEEANEIAKFMLKDIKYTAIFLTKFEEESVYSVSGASHDVGEMPTEIQIKVENFDTGQVNNWTIEKFQDRLAMMRDNLQQYEENQSMDIAPEHDPFNEKQEAILLGQAFYLLEGLAYLLDDPRKMPIVSPNNQIVGHLHMNIVPCLEDGNEDIPEDDLPEQPEDLKDQPLYFKVKISELTNLSENFGSNLHCEYKFYLDEEPCKTNVVTEKASKIDVAYEYIHHIDCVTDYLLKYLQDEKLTIKIFGTQDLKKQGKAKVVAKAPAQAAPK